MVFDDPDDVLPHQNAAINAAIRWAQIGGFDSMVSYIIYFLETGPY